jgi:hypothetical protein
MSGGKQVGESARAPTASLPNVVRGLCCSASAAFGAVVGLRMLQAWRRPDIPPDFVGSFAPVDRVGAAVNMATALAPAAGRWPPGR